MLLFGVIFAFLMVINFLANLDNNCPVSTASEAVLRSEEYLRKQGFMANGINTLIPTQLDIWRMIQCTNWSDIVKEKCEIRAVSFRQWGDGWLVAFATSPDRAVGRIKVFVSHSGKCKFFGGEPEIIIDGFKDLYDYDWEIESRRIRK